MINDCLADREKAEKEIHEKGSITIKITDLDGNSKDETVNNIKDWEDLSEWNKFVLIPVLVTTDSSSSNSYYGSSNVISIQHDLKPGYARMAGGMRLRQNVDLRQPCGPTSRGETLFAYFLSVPRQCMTMLRNQR